MGLAGHITVLERSKQAENEKRVSFLFLLKRHSRLLEERINNWFWSVINIRAPSILLQGSDKLPTFEKEFHLMIADWAKRSSEEEFFLAKFSNRA